MFSQPKAICNTEVDTNWIDAGASSLSRWSTELAVHCSCQYRRMIKVIPHAVMHWHSSERPCVQV